MLLKRLGLLAIFPTLIQAAEFRVPAAADTAAIQQTIDLAAKSKGTVVFSPGVYRTGALFLKTGITFRVDEGVTILGVQNIEAYPMMPTRVAGIEMVWPAALINVYEQSNVKITGKGLIDGDGKIWWDQYWKMRREEYEPKGLRWAVDYDCRRPRLIQIYKSTGVSLEGLTLKRPGFWTVHICYSNDIAVDGLTIRNNTEARGPSTDGIDIDSSTHVLVRHCDIECNDDAICLKAGRDADGLRVNRATSAVTIMDNTVRSGAAGVTFGSETSGGIHDVTVYGLTVTNPVPAAILFKSASTRGGTIERIRISHVTARDVPTVLSITMNWNPSYSYASLPPGITNVPDYWKVLLTPVPPERGIPHFQNVRISDVTATGAKQAFAVSSNESSPLRDFVLQNWDVQAQTRGSIRNDDSWIMDGVRIKTDRH